MFELFIINNKSFWVSSQTYIFIINLRYDWFSNIIVLVWSSIALYTLYKVFQPDDNDDDSKEKKSFLFRFLCLSTIATVTILTIISWKSSSTILVDDIYNTFNVVDNFVTNVDFNVNNIDCNNLDFYTKDQLNQVLTAFNNNEIFLDGEDFDKIFDYVMKNK